MPNRNQLRRRRRANDLDQPTPPSAAVQSNAPTRILTTLKPALLPLAKISGALILGVATAASFSSLGIGILLFVATILAVFVSLFFVFLSIFKERNQTAVYMPDVYNPDGTVVAQQQMTAFEHDEKAAKYFSRELPAMAVATVWFYLWSQFKLSFALYTAFVAWRILAYPLFRIHLWNEPVSGELGRPFGAAPLFEKDSTTKVHVIEGDVQFQQALEKAKKGTLVVVDCSATWCAPCKQMAPYFAKIAEEFSDHTFLSIDVDISRDVATNLVITSVPSFVIFKEGQRMEMLRGASPEKLRSSIQSYI